MSDKFSRIKELREMTGSGFLDCKKALELNENDIEKSITFLRKKGLSKASKKSSRIANEGAVGVFTNKDKVVLLEINTETDFSAKNEVFLNFIEKISNIAFEYNEKGTVNVDKFLETKIENKKLSDEFNDIIAKVGENIILRRLTIIEKNNKNKIFTYTHNSYKENIGKICVVLNAEIEDDNAEVSKLGKNLCMHIAAMKPLSLDVEDLDLNLVQNEKEIQKESIKSSGKQENMIEKILIGKMNKFYSEVTLFNQKYILDDKKTVKSVIKEFNSSNNKFNISNYYLYVLGS